MVEQLDKVRKLKSIKENNGYKYDIQIYGGISIDNIKDVIEAGANCIVAGFSVFGKNNIGEAAKQFIDIFKEYDEI